MSQRDSQPGRKERPEADLRGWGRGPRAGADPSGAQCPGLICILERCLWPRCEAPGGRERAEGMWAGQRDTGTGQRERGLSRQGAGRWEVNGTRLPSRSAGGRAGGVVTGVSECAAGRRCQGLPGTNTCPPAPDTLLLTRSHAVPLPSPRPPAPVAPPAPPSCPRLPPTQPPLSPPGPPSSHPTPLPSQGLGIPASRADRLGHDPFGAARPPGAAQAARPSPSAPRAAAPGPFPARTRSSSLRPWGQALLRSPPRPGPRRAPHSPGRGPRPRSPRWGPAAAAPPASARPAFPGPRPAQADPGFYCSLSPSR